jgi:hypothetical protein
MAREGSTLLDFSAGAQQSIHRAHRAQIPAVVEQLSMNLRHGEVDESVAMQLAKDGLTLRIWDAAAIPAFGAFHARRSDGTGKTPP